LIHTQLEYKDRSLNIESLKKRKRY